MTRRGIDQARTLLAGCGSLSDEQINAILDDLYELADVTTDAYLATKNAVVDDSWENPPLEELQARFPMIDFADAPEPDDLYDGWESDPLLRNDAK